MAEGFDPSDAPVTRGRRDPELAMALTDPDLLQDAGEGDSADQTYIGLATGDIVMAKVTHAFTRNDGGDSWFSYGVQTRVLDGEVEEDTYMRAATIVNERVLDMADDAEVRVSELAAASRSNQPARRGR